MKKGFTLVEIIISISLILIIGVVGLSAFIIKKDDKKLDELETIAYLYYQNNFENGEYKYYTTEDGEQISCIKLDTLVQDGLISEDNKILEEYNEDAIFKYTVDKEGLFTLEEVTEDECAVLGDEPYIFTSVQNLLSDDYENNGKNWPNRLLYAFQTDSNNNLFGSFEIIIHMQKQAQYQQGLAPLYIALVLDRTKGFSNGGDQPDSSCQLNSTGSVQNSLNALLQMLRAQTPNSYIAAVEFKESESTIVSKNDDEYITEAYHLVSDVTDVNNLGLYLSNSSYSTGYGFDGYSDLYSNLSDLANNTPNGEKFVAILLSVGYTLSDSSFIYDINSLKNSERFYVISLGYGRHRANSIDYTNNPNYVDIAQNIIGESYLTELSSELSYCNTYNLSRKCSESSGNDKCCFAASNICDFHYSIESIGSIISSLAPETSSDQVTNSYNTITYEVLTADYFKIEETSISDSPSVNGYSVYTNHSPSKLWRQTINHNTEVTSITNANIIPSYKINFLKDDFKSEHQDNPGTYELDVIKELTITLSGSGADDKVYKYCSDEEQSCYSDKLPKLTVTIGQDDVIN